MTSSPTAAEVVRRATPADVGRVADVLASAFFEDPVMAWCYPDPEHRAQLLPDLFRVIVEETVPAGGVDTVADELAAAVWVPAGAQIDEERMVNDLGDISSGYRERLFTLLALLDENHPHDAAHAYLFVLGTRPQWQSRGLGSALLRSALGPCDRDGSPAYLEATSEGSKRLYERHGFEVTDVLHLPDGPPLWCMWRTPRAS